MIGSYYITMTIGIVDFPLVSPVVTQFKVEILCPTNFSLFPAAVVNIVTQMPQTFFEYDVASQVELQAELATVEIVSLC